MLLKNAGSESRQRVFRATVRDIIQADGLPNHRLSNAPGDMIVVTRKDDVLEDTGQVTQMPETLEKACGLCPGTNIYALEAERRGFAQPPPA